MIYAATPGFDNLEKIVRRTAKALRAHDAEFDAIAVSGMSGMSVGAPVALRVRKPLILVRKKDENRHGTSDMIPKKLPSGAQRVLFLDDFISSGETEGRVKEVVGARGGTVVASYEYDHDSYTNTALTTLFP